MDIEQFNFTLPDELIAQTPLRNRSSSKLLVVQRQPYELKHKTFPSIIDYIDEGDCVVLNNTKVLPARLFGEKAKTGAKIEILLLEEIKQDEWITLTKPARKIKIGDRITFGDGILQATCINIGSEGKRTYRLTYKGCFQSILEKFGHMPLPPYITKQLDDHNRYQTVFSTHAGSSAAPTAGLHFTDELINEIEKKGASIAYVTLHVGLGTFRPVNVKNIEDHKMHAESYYIEKEEAEKIQKTKESGGKVLAVGTTSVRVLETIASKYNGKIVADEGKTNIFIYPPYTFKIVDRLLTNFHLPKSTLLMLVSAFGTREMMLHTYKTAIEKKYRFFSFGDAMLIL